MEFVEKQLSTKVTYEGKVINITLDDIELPDGKKSFREVIRHPGGVVAVAMKDENTIIFRLTRNGQAKKMKRLIEERL